MPAAQDVNQEWLRAVLSGAGYNVTISDEMLLARHSSRPNLGASIRLGNGIISFRHVWGTQVGFGKDKDFRKALNLANRSSWYDTFYVDDEGDLIVSFYIPLTESLTEQDVVKFIEQESVSFQLIVVSSGLVSFVK